MSTNVRKLNLKRKCYARGAKRPVKKFRRLPKAVRDNPENEKNRHKDDVKDIYDFRDEDNSVHQDGDENGETQDNLNVSDLLKDMTELKQKELIAINQDSVRPLYTKEADFDERKLNDALNELRYTSFRPNQKETIKRILFGRSTLFISATGSGKSLCYQLPALLYWKFRRYMTIVVSPLISLMEDQIHSFPKSLKAVCLHSGHSRAQKQRSIQQLVNGEAQVAFISPEAIVGGALELNDLRNLPPVGFVCVDEAHCLSEWSSNFRPAYLQFFKILNEQMKIKTFLGLTATANKETAYAISKNLIINPEYDVVGSTMIPENLVLSVSHEQNKKDALLRLLQSPTFKNIGSIIVYCNRRDQTEAIAMLIRTAMQDYSNLIETPSRRQSRTAATNNENKSVSDDSSKTTNRQTADSSSKKSYTKLTWHAEYYHAGLSMDARDKIQRQFIKNEIRVVVATIAFGMGINKANVRAIIHYDMPSSFESYVQEIGRAGRDNKISQCHMFLSDNKTDLYYHYRNIYANTTERKNLRKLVDLVFRPCKCRQFNKCDKALLDKRNSIDPSYVPRNSYGSSEFFTPELLEDSANYSPDSNEENFAQNENTSHTSFVGARGMKRSVVEKHRLCKGHELTINIDEVVAALNLKPESVLTLITQLQQNYPQLQIRLFAPTRATCQLFCYKGPEQMEQLAKVNPAVAAALFKYKLKYKRDSGSMPNETPNKIVFNVVDVANTLAKPLSEVVRMLIKTEWLVNEKNGGYKRSQVRVSFKDNAFYLRAVGDLSGEEIEEINEFLITYEQTFELMERKKLQQVFSAFVKFAIPLEQMHCRTTRVDASNKLKAALNRYFSSSDGSCFEKGIENDYEETTKTTCDANTSDSVVSIASKSVSVAKNASVLNVATSKVCSQQPLNPKLLSPLKSQSNITTPTKKLQQTNTFVGGSQMTTTELPPSATKTTKSSTNVELTLASIRKDARDFISENGDKDFTPRTIARIFQGISTPNYPAELWAHNNRRWWRKHLDVDFQQLTSLIHEQFMKASS